MSQAANQGYSHLSGIESTSSVVEMAPARVAARSARGRRRRAGRVAVEPELDAVVVKLLGPQQPGVRLALDQPLVVVQNRRQDGGVKRVGFGDPPAEDRVEVAEGFVERAVSKSSADGEARRGRAATSSAAAAFAPAAGLTRSRRPATTYSWKASLT